MRILAIDLGNRRVGLALSDPGGMIASPLQTLDRKAGGWRELLHSLIAQHDVGEIVVGLPKNMDGTLGEQAQRCQAFAEELREHSGLPVHLLDERLTSKAAGAALRESGKRPSREKGSLDAVAASLILQIHLEQRKRTSL